MKNVILQAEKAKNAAKKLRQADSNSKNNFLFFLAELLDARTEWLLAENRKDLAEAAGITAAMRRRLEFSPENIAKMAEGVRSIAALPDPVGQIIKSWVRSDGLKIARMRVPIGVIAFIFESRPNAIIDAASLCVKSGNAVIMRCGKEALHSSDALMMLIAEAFQKARLPLDAVQQLEDRRYEAIHELVGLERYVDLVIPRGREELIQAILAHARVPVIKHGKGLCHAYIDKEADIGKAVAVVVNAKTSNPATCNAIETLLVHKDIADRVMPKLLAELISKRVEIRGCPRTRSYEAACHSVTEDDWATEYLDLVLAVKVINSFDEAIQHIERYGSGLAESIITENETTAEQFLARVDSATVLVNASNRLTDGNELGLGGEIGISTACIHARGPMGLEDLTVPRYVVHGNGHIRE